MNEKTRQIIVDIQKFKGEKFAVFCCIEEMAELSKELLKNINRGKDNRDDILGELADVMICLEHLKMIYDIQDTQLWQMINEKMPRKWNQKIDKWKTEIGKVNDSVK